MRRLLSLLLLGLFLCLSLAGCGRVDGQPFQPTVTQALRLTSGHTLGQSFRLMGGDVTGLDLLVATFGETPPADLRLRVTVRDPMDNTVLWSDTAGAAEIGDNQWVRFEGEPVADPPSVAALEVSATGGGTVGLWANIPPEQWNAGIPLNDPYPGGELLVDGFHAPGDLAFRVTADGGLSAGLAGPARLARSAGGRLLDTPLFAAAWLLLFGGAVALATAGLRRSRAVVQLDQPGPDQQHGGDQERGAQQAEQPLGQA